LGRGTANKHIFNLGLVAEKNATKNILGRMEGRTEVKQYTPHPPSGGAGV